MTAPGLTFSHFQCGYSSDIIIVLVPLKQTYAVRSSEKVYCLAKSNFIKVSVYSNQECR